MGRGNLTDDEVRIILKNPYVKSVKNNRITYTEDFKILFIKKYFSGEKPMDIFIDAGFDVKILGTKRIERAAARWRESNAAGQLGDHYNNDFYKDKRNSRREMQLIIYELKKENKRLREKIEMLEKSNMVENVEDIL